MRKRKFEEEVVEETTDTVTEGTDSHDQFVSLLVDMGLNAEQAEAVHSMAMDLVNAGDGETTEKTEQVNEEKIEAGRHSRRGMGRKKEYSRRGRASMGRNERMGSRRRRSMSRESSGDERMERRMRRLARQNRELRSQLQELGARPAARPLSNRPTESAPAQNFGTANSLTKSTQQALDMINSFKK